MKICHKVGIDMQASRKVMWIQKGCETDNNFIGNVVEPRGNGRADILARYGKRLQSIIEGNARAC